MGLRWMTWAAAAAVAISGLAGSANAVDPVPNKPWSGEVKPDAGWLTRQGVAASYPISFMIDAKDQAAGSIEFKGGANPADGGHGALTGKLDLEDFGLIGFVDAHSDLSPTVQAKARVRVVLNGFVREDGSLSGVGVLDMADLACLNDPARAEAAAPCPRRMVPIKWSAKQ